MDMYKWRDIFSKLTIENRILIHLWNVNRHS